MMAKRELDLVPRVEAVRDERKIQPPVHFSLAEILQHYSESYAAIRNQFVVADQMLQEGNEEACKMILRSQVVLAEGLLDFYIHELSKFCMFQMFAGQWNKSDKYNQFMVPMAKVEEGLAATESREWFFELLNNRFGRGLFVFGKHERSAEYDWNWFYGCNQFSVLGTTRFSGIWKEKD